MEKILEKSGKSQGILSVRKSGNPVIACQSFHWNNMEKPLLLQGKIPKLQQLFGKNWLQALPY